jgi:hypothetical protein
MATTARAMAMATKRAKVTDKEGHGDGSKSNGDGNEEGDGESGKSNGEGVKEGIDGSNKGNGDGNKEGKVKGGKGNGNGDKGVGRGMAMATKRAMGSAMVTAMRVADAKESAGNGNCNCNSN